MLYKFKSSASGDVVMVRSSAEQILEIIKKEPAEQGLVLVADMPDAMLEIEKAIVVSEASNEDRSNAGGVVDEAPIDVTLRQRAWPFLELLRRSHAAGVDVGWGF